MNVYVIDSGRLAGEADFPMLDLPKFGWQQFPELAPEEVGERCWRADVLVTVATPVDRATIDQAFKLKLIAVAGMSVDHVDLDAARERGIQVCNVPGLDPADHASSQEICFEVVENIHAFLRDEERNRVA